MILHLNGKTGKNAPRGDFPAAGLRVSKAHLRRFLRSMAKDVFILHFLLTVFHHRLIIKPEYIIS